MVKHRKPLTQSTRSEIITRCNGICEQCNESHVRDIHHIDKNPSNNNIENLIGVCYSCHKEIHWGKTEPSRLIHLSVSIYLLKRIDELINTGRFDNRSECIRYLLEFALNKIKEQETMLNLK